MEQLKNNIDRICYVCGFDFDTENIKERQSWPFIFCPCCCFEYGIEDLEFDCFTIMREEWINGGLKFGYKLHPVNYVWNIDVVVRQLENLNKVDLSRYPLGKEMNPNYRKEVDYKTIQFNWEKARLSK